MSDEQIIKYVSKENLKTVYDALSSKVGQISVNNIHPDVNGNIKISRVDYANQAGTATDLESTSYVTQTATFLFRTTGGSDDVFSGKAQIKEIHGNSYQMEEIPSDVEAFLASEENIDDWEVTVSVADFESALGQNKKEGIYSFSNNNNTWSLLRPNTDISENISSIQDWGIKLLAPSGASFEGLTITCNYKIGFGAIHIPGKLINLSSIGFNLYNYNTGYAKVIGNEQYIVQYNDNIDNYVIKFIDDIDGSSEWNEINYINTTVGLTKLSHVFIPEKDGYIAFFNNDTLAHVENLMVNLIWSGKKIDENGQTDFQQYQEYTKTFYDEESNNSGVTLDRLDDVYDTIDFLTVVEKENNILTKYYKKIQRIFNFTYTGADLDTYFKNIKYFKSGNDIYYDCLSLNEHVDDLPNVDKQKHTFRFPEDDKVIDYHNEVYESLIFVEDSGINIEATDLKNDNSYIMDDFGLEKVNAIYKYSNIDYQLPMEFVIVYQANLIDKLRRSVITYSLQPDVSDDERATGRQNLNLISVKCFTGKRTIKVKANQINGEGEVILKGPEVFSDEKSQYAIFQLPSLGTWEFSSIINGETISIIQNINFYGDYDIKLVGKRYGFKREKRNLDSANRITYLFDAEGFAPIAYNEEQATFNLGDWSEFINEVAAPVCIGRKNGERVIKLSRTNQLQTIDGNNLDAEENGDFMVGFYKYKYVARKQDSLYEYVVFCDEDLSDDEWDYQCYAHAITTINEDGNIVLKPGNAFYWGMFNGSYTRADASSTNIKDIQLRSVPSLSTADEYTAPSYSLASFETIARHRNNYKANDSNSKALKWNIGYKSAWDYICDLITLVTKNDNAQETFGVGLGYKATASAGAFVDDSWSGSGFVYGIDSTLTGNIHTRMFWIWDFYGNIRQPLLGFFRRNITTANNINNTNYYVKMHDADAEYLPVTSTDGDEYTTFGLNFDSSATTADLTSDTAILDTYKYIKIPQKLTVVTSNYISDEVVNKNGFIPLKATITTNNSGISDILNAAGSYARFTYFATMGLGATNTNGANLTRNGPRTLDFVFYTKATSAAATPSLITFGNARPRLTCIEPEGLYETT